MKVNRTAILLVALLVLGLSTLACGQLGLPRLDATEPAPTASLSSAAILPTVSVEPTATTVISTKVPPTSVATAVPLPTATAAPVRSAAVAPAPTTTVDPHLVVITEQDIASSIASGAATSAGLETDNLEVQFTGGKTNITADQIAYGPINLQKLALVGRLVAKDGALQMDFESVSPQGFVSGMIPNMVNQALKQYASQYYVEDVRTDEGQVVLRIR